MMNSRQAAPFFLSRLVRLWSLVSCFSMSPAEDADGSCGKILVGVASAPSTGFGFSILFHIMDLPSRRTKAEASLGVGLSLFRLFIQYT